MTPITSPRANALLLQPCMGGMCHLRDRCPHYDSPSRTDPSERLCDPGRDGVRVGLVAPKLPTADNYVASAVQQ